MKKFFILFAMALLVTIGCKQMIVWKYGITSPRSETPESVVSFARGFRQDPENIFIFRDTTGYFAFMQDSIYRKSCFSAIVFNAKGMLIRYKDTGSCQWSAAAAVKRLKKDTVYSVEGSCSLATLTAGLVSASGDSVFADRPDSIDFTVIYTWANYLGKLNERLFAIGEAVRNNPNARIRVISLNIDMQKSWKLRKDQMVRFNKS